MLGKTSLTAHQRCDSHNSSKSTRDLSPRKADVICSNDFNGGNLDGDRCLRCKQVAPTQSYLPVTSKLGWNLQSQLLKLLIPVLLILPVPRITTTCCQQDGHRAQQEQGPGWSSMDFSGTCNNNNKKQAEILSLGDRSKNEEVIVNNTAY